jgi:hypothetical protein
LKVKINAGFSPQRNKHYYAIINPSPFEVEVAIAKSKRYKSPGSNQIPAELIQAGSDILHSKIHKLITSIWNKEKLPACLQSCYLATDVV